MTRLVLITGGAGFVGSNLARSLTAKGDRVRIVDDLSVGRPEYLRGLALEFRRANIADSRAVQDALSGVDAVVHLAARAGIPDSVSDPLGTLEANVTRTVALLDAVRLAGVPRFVLASSNAATGDHEPPADESDLPHPVSPYGASKLAGEAYCQAYAATYGIATTILRFSNAYGPCSMHKKSVVAAWMRAALSNEPIAIHGDGEQTRDFVFVDDLAAAVIGALDAPPELVSGEVFQAGTGIETSVNELAEAVGRAVGAPLEVHHVADRPGDVRRNVSRVDKAANRLGYRARTPLQEGLNRTASWFRSALADPALAGVGPSPVSGSE